MGPLGTHLQAAAAGDFPGIFLNGLLVFGRVGAVIFERCLARDHALHILEQAERSGLDVLFYAGDRVLDRERTPVTGMFVVSHEPVPTIDRSGRSGARPGGTGGQSGMKGALGGGGRSSGAAGDFLVKAAHLAWARGF